MEIQFFLLFRLYTLSEIFQIFLFEVLTFHSVFVFCCLSVYFLAFCEHFWSMVPLFLNLRNLSLLFLQIFLSCPYFLSHWIFYCVVFGIYIILHIFIFHFYFFIFSAAFWQNTSVWSSIFPIYSSAVLVCDQLCCLLHFSFVIFLLKSLKKYPVYLFSIANILCVCVCV